MQWMRQQRRKKTIDEEKCSDGNLREIGVLDNQLRIQTDRILSSFHIRTIENIYSAFTGINYLPGHVVIQKSVTILNRRKQATTKNIPIYDNQENKRIKYDKCTLSHKYLFGM